MREPVESLYEEVAELVLTAGINYGDVMRMKVPERMWWTQHIQELAREAPWRFNLLPNLPPEMLASVLGNLG